MIIFSTDLTAFELLRYQRLLDLKIIARSFIIVDRYRPGVILAPTSDSLTADY